MRSQMTRKFVMGIALTLMSGVLMAPSKPVPVLSIPSVGNLGCSGTARHISVNNCNIGRCLSAKFTCPQNFEMQLGGGMNTSGQPLTEFADPVACNAIGQCPAVHPSRTPPTCVSRATGFTTPANWQPGQCSNRVAECGGTWVCSNPRCRPQITPSVQCSFTGSSPSCQVPASAPNCVP